MRNRQRAPILFSVARAAAGAVVGISVVILVGIFMMQSLGTAKVSLVFAPVIMLWFLTNAA